MFNFKKGIVRFLPALKSQVYRVSSDRHYEELKLEIKSNYQVFPVDVRGIDWVGYVHHRNYTKIRKSIKKRYIKNNNKITHYSWLKHCNSKNLRNKYEVNL